MTQSVLKDEIQEKAEGLVSDALSSIRDVIKTNLEKGLDVFEESKTVQKDETATTEDSIEFKEDKNTADVLFLTDVLEKDGSITTLEKKETGMRNTKTEDLNEAPEEMMDEASIETKAEEAIEVEVSSFSEENNPEIASKETMAESAAAFSELANMARQMSANPKGEASEPVTSGNAGNYTVDSLMRELLRPMLKEWLDAHLPSLVKWLVTEQIEKMLKAQLGDAYVKGAPAEAKSETESFLEEVKPAQEAALETKEEDPTAAMNFDAPAA